MVARLYWFQSAPRYQLYDKTELIERHTMKILLVRFCFPDLLNWRYSRQCKYLSPSSTVRSRFPLVKVQCSCFCVPIQSTRETNLSRKIIVSCAFAKLIFRASDVTHKSHVWLIYVRAWRNLKMNHKQIADRDLMDTITSGYDSGSGDQTAIGLNPEI